MAASALSVAHLVFSVKEIRCGMGTRGAGNGGPPPAPWGPIGRNLGAGNRSKFSPAPRAPAGTHGE